MGAGGDDVGLFLHLLQVYKNAEVVYYLSFNPSVDRRTWGFVHGIFWMEWDMAASVSLDF